MNRKTFEWTLGLPPPKLQPHSVAKLRLIEHYLGQYFDTVTANPKIDKLQISLIDGFCGGGIFKDSKKNIVYGTPMIMLRSVKNAEIRINQNRHKKLIINAKYYFIDKSKPAIDYLKNEIRNSEFASKIVDGSIQILHGKFEKTYENIIQNLHSNTQKGRSIFLLDQCGYKQVPLYACRSILESLPKSEIILTFAMDWLIDLVSLKQKFLRSVESLGLRREQIEHFLENKHSRNYRYLTQLILAKHLQHETNAPYFTPFFLRSEEAHRDLWLLHFSKHPTARNVMVFSHWGAQNSSIHHGKAGLGMLGFDPNWEETSPLDFGFDNSAEKRTEKALLKDIPHRIEDLSGYGAIPYAAFLHEIVNETPATYDQINHVLQKLYKETDIEIRTASGRLKKTDTQIKVSDFIQFSQQRTFFDFKKPK